MKYYLMILAGIYSASAFAQTPSFPLVQVNLNGHPRGAGLSVPYKFESYEGKKRFNHCAGVDGQSYFVGYSLSDALPADVKDEVEVKMPDKDGYVAGVCRYVRLSNAPFFIVLSKDAKIRVSEGTVSTEEYLFDVSSKKIGCYGNSALIFKDGLPVKEIEYNKGQRIRLELKLAP